MHWKQTLREFFRRHPIELHVERRVEFLGAQDGPPEREFKAALVRDLANFPDVSRAYLARVGFQPTEAPAVAICLVSVEPGDRALLLRIQSRFASMFNREVALDILFLSTEQEADIARVCAPFYVAAV